MSSKKTAVLQKHDDDVVVVTAIRSAITKVRSFTMPIILLKTSNGEKLELFLFFINRAKRAVSKIQNQNLSSLMSFVQLTQKSILIPNSLKISLSETSFLLVEVRTLLAWQLFTLEFQLKLRSTPSIDSVLQDCRLLTRLRTRFE